MFIKPESHLLTSVEISEIKTLGYQFHGITSSPEDFINTKFPNFNLLLFLKNVNEIFNLVCDAANKLIYLENSTSSEIRIQYFTDDFEDEINGLALSRIFIRQSEELVVKHDFFRLSASSRGKGIAKQIFRVSLQQYLNMGVNKILVHAALNDGGYAWARNHFAAINRSEINQILDNARSKLTEFQFQAIEKIYINYYSKYPAGMDFPIVKWAELPFMKKVLRGSSWHGVIDLKNQEQFANFISYVFN